MEKKIMEIRHVLYVFIHQFNSHWDKNKYRYLLIFFTFFILHEKDIDINFQLGNKKEIISQNNNIPEKELIIPIVEKHKIKKNKKLKPHYLNYIDEYKSIAIKEMNLNGVPASVTMAQALLESNGGKSRLANKCNNHFGIKCFSRKCKKGHCHNFEDDTHKDFFRKYNSVAASYEAHSLFLKKKRYIHLFDLNESDYKSWCRGLRKAGYATDKKYAEKLISLIENYELNKLDKK